MAANHNRSEGDIVEELMTCGATELQAELWLAFIPLGLGRALISRLSPGAPILCADSAHIRDCEMNRDYEVQLSEVEEFVVAARLGEETFMTGIIPREQFTLVVRLSAEVNAANSALNAGKPVAGSRIYPPVLLRLAGTDGFENWLLNRVSDSITGIDRER